MSKEMATGGSMNAFPRAQQSAMGQQSQLGQMGMGMGQMGQMGQIAPQQVGQQVGQPAMGNNALLAQMNGLQSLMGAYGMGMLGVPQLPQTPANFRPGDWMCKCGNHNYASKTICVKCQSTKDQGDISNLGVLAGLGMGGMGLPSNVPSGFRQGDWMCKCGNHNYAKRETCGRCDGPKSENDSTHSNNRPQNFQVGDWMCVCGAHNYRSKAACHKCNVTKEQGCVTTGGVSSNPNYRAGDWMCKCGNHNFASRTHCKICNLPKEAGAVDEQRSRSRSPNRNGQARERSRSPVAAAY
jgi:hypothetical protein